MDEHFFKKLAENVSKKQSIKSKIYKPNWRKVLDSCYIPRNPRHREREITALSDLLPALKGEGSPKGNWLLPRLTTVSSPSVGVIGPGQSDPLVKRRR